jgi:hypothetical protein
VGIFDGLRQRAPDPAPTSGNADGVARLSRLDRLPRWLKILGGLVLLAVGYYGIGGAILSDTSADTTLRPTADLLPPGGSVTVATAAMLIDDAINNRGWTPNNGLLAPTATLDEMPAFQRGQQAVIAAYAGALSTATGGDPDTAEAAEALATDPGRSWIHADFPFFGGSAEARYSAAVGALARYNRALGDSGAAPAEAAQLRLLLVAIDRAIANKVAIVDDEVKGRAPPGENRAAKFHQVRGAAYAAAMLLRGLVEDFGPVIRDRKLGAALAAAIEDLDSIAASEPFSVGLEDLVGQGYRLLTARAALATVRSGTAS